jgi:twinkle protein
MLTSEQLRPIAQRRSPGQYRMHCPACNPTRKNKREMTLSLSVEEHQFMWNCWHCDDKGRAFTFEQRPREKPVQPKPIQADDLTDLTPEAQQFLASRGIHMYTSLTNVRSCVKFFGNLQREAQAIAFVSRNERGLITSIKYRALEDKSFSAQGSQGRYWNLENAKEGQPLVITEGELDTLALIESGIQNAISVPSGAPSPGGSAQRESGGRFGYVASGEKLYATCGRIILFTDQDEPGRALADELARRIGKHRCYFVMVPLDCKDANDVLLRHGKEKLREIIEQAKPWPVAGLYEATHYTDKVLDLYNKGAGKGIGTGLNAVDEIYTVAPGMVTVVTGVPSSGKSEFIDQLMINLATREGWTFCVASFENPPERHIVKLAEKHTGLPFFDGPSQRLDQSSLSGAIEWVSNHFLFIEAADGQPSTIDSILERASIAVMRKGIRGLVIDPYNFIEKSGKEQTETEQVSDMLTKVKRFANSHEVHIWFVAHPMKMYRNPDGTTSVPTGYDILGSSHWFNKADFGLTVHRAEGATMIRCWKARFKWVAKNGDAYLTYDVVNGRYSDGKEPEPDPLPTARVKVKRSEEGTSGYWHD